MSEPSEAMVTCRDEDMSMSAFGEVFGKIDVRVVGIVEVEEPRFPTCAKPCQDSCY